MAVFILPSGMPSVRRYVAMTGDAMLSYTRTHARTHAHVHAHAHTHKHNGNCTGAALVSYFRAGRSDASTSGAQSCPLKPAAGREGSQGESA